VISQNTRNYASILPDLYCARSWNETVLPNTLTETVCILRLICIDGHWASPFGPFNPITSVCSSSTNGQTETPSLFRLIW
jgi:hypothetical protein